MTTSLLPRFRTPRTLSARADDAREAARRLRRRLEQHRDALSVTAGLVLGGAFLAVLLLACGLLLLQLLAVAIAPAANELGIGS